VSYLTTGQVAELVSKESGVEVREWRIRRLYEDQRLPDPPRFGLKRMIARNQVPIIVAKLQEMGVLPAPNRISRTRKTVPART
jgi:hypothetical protein